MKRLPQQDLRGFYACARNCDRAVIVLKGKRGVQWMTEPARQCVAEFFGKHPPQKNRLPKPMAKWIEQQSRKRDGKRSALPKAKVVERNGERLVLRVVTDKRDGTRLVRLEKREPVLSAPSLERLGLSRREAEVLRWLARGMSNAEIARFSA